MLLPLPTESGEPSRDKGGVVSSDDLESRLGSLGTVEGCELPLLAVVVPLGTPLVFFLRSHSALYRSYPSTNPESTLCENMISPFGFDATGIVCKGVLSDGEVGLDFSEPFDGETGVECVDMRAADTTGFDQKLRKEK